MTGFISAGNEYTQMSCRRSSCDKLAIQGIIKFNRDFLSSNPKMIVFRYKELLFRKKAAKSLTNETEDEGLSGEFGSPAEWLLLHRCLSPSG